jgi:hypothetical protein
LRGRLKRTPDEKAAYEARKAAAAAPAASPLDALRARPELLAELREKIRAEPTSAPKVIMGLMEAEPQIAKAIMSAREEFKALMREGSSKL